MGGGALWNGGGNSPVPWDSSLFPRVETLEISPLGVRRGLGDYKVMTTPSPLPHHTRDLA